MNDRDVNNNIRVQALPTSGGRYGSATNLIRTHNLKNNASGINNSQKIFVTSSYEWWLSGDSVSEELV